jgi:hypothetical protein
MRGLEEIVHVLALVEQGENDCEISRRTGVPRGTVKDWRRGKLPSIWRRAENESWRGSCPRCRHPAHDYGGLPPAHYAYLLGIYLGDGTLSRHRREVYRLRIFLDARYPGIIDEAATAMAVVMPSSKVSRQLKLWRGKPSLYEVHAYSQQWPCLFPQHGPGMKHTRPIVLADWQERVVETHTKPSARPHPFRRMARNESRHRPRQDLLVSALPVLQRLRRHSRPLLQRVRSPRRGVAADERSQHLGCPPRVGRIPRYVHRAQVLSRLSGRIPGGRATECA